MKSYFDDFIPLEDINYLEYRFAYSNISVALLFISRKLIVAWLEINNNEGETEKLSFMQIFVNKVPCDIVLKIHQRKKNNELL